MHKQRIAESDWVMVDPGGGAIGLTNPNAMWVAATSGKDDGQAALGRLCLVVHPVCTAIHVLEQAGPVHLSPFIDDVVGSGGTRLELLITLQSLS